MGNVFESPSDDQKDETPAEPQYVTPPAPEAEDEGEDADGYREIEPGVRARRAPDDVRAEREAAQESE